VLLLSQFAGAAEELQEALIVNPYDADDVADRLHEALMMPRDERRSRHAALLARIRLQDAKAWLEGFLARLDPAEPAPRAPATSASPARRRASAALDLGQSA